MSQAHDSINAVGEVFTEQAKGATAIGLLVSDLGFSMVMPFLRRNLGENFLSPFLIIVMTVFTFTMCHVMKVNPTFITGYVILLFIASLYHLAVIHRKNYRGEIFYSHSQGDFLSFLKKLPRGDNYWLVEGCYEPALVFIISAITTAFIDKGLGGLFAFSAFWMVLRSRYHYFVDRKRLLAERDALIISEYKLDAINGKPSSETKGFIVKNINRMKPQDKRAVARGLLGEKDFSQFNV